MTSQPECPFKIGDTVFYRPSDRLIGLSANDRPSQTPKIGEAVKITNITKGAYVEVECYEHPGGGLHWTAFSTI